MQQTDALQSDQSTDTTLKYHCNYGGKYCDYNFSVNDHFCFSFSLSLQKNIKLMMQCLLGLVPNAHAAL